MKRTPLVGRYLTGGFLAALLALLATLPVPARILDDFSGGKNGWEDFEFLAALPNPVVEGGQFKFLLPPAGQSLFTASTKKSETFELKDGRTIEFRVDLVNGGAKDSFAILAFIPTGTGAQTLAGYGLAKSTTDVLITKGIGKYFFSENLAQPVKNENVALSLTMAAKGGTVTVTARVLDKANNDAVLFEKIVVDTPAADVMADGTDDPPAPWITQGHFVLYLYEDFDAGAPEDPYQAIYDNAEVFVTDTVVLDDFENGKVGWEDFEFLAALPNPVVEGGRFKFVLPPAGQALFTASTKKSKTFELKEGERLQFNVDVVESGAKDSFPVLGFIPSANGAQTLAGYGFAKSSTDVLITKGIGKYFHDETPATPIKNENITLSLTMTVRGGSVHVNARVLDKDANNAVLFEKTVIDTPAADVMAGGTDDPSAPWITQGNFVLYLYQDFDAGAPEDPYKATFDNAVVASVPAAGNEPPVITEVLPVAASNFLPASTTLSFKASDDKAIADGSVSITLNGTVYTTANGLAVGGSGNSRSVSLSGKLVANVNYTALLKVIDSDGVVREQTLKFDTFDTSNFVVEVEDYNFAAGQYVNNPVPLPLGGAGEASYSSQEGVRDVDYNETRTGPNGADTKYRPVDPVRMAWTLDKARKKFTDAGGTAAEVYDYDVGDHAAGEWQQYTRSFKSGTYEVYLRTEVVNMPFGDSVLELVTGDRTQPNAAARTLGTFLCKRGGFDYQNVPLTDGSGVKNAVLRLNGVTTLRLRHLTADPGDGYRLMNYLVFIPVPDPGVQRATVSSTAPAPNSTVETVTPAIAVTIQNRDTTVNVSSIRLELNGQVVLGAKVQATADGATVDYPISPLPAAGASNTATVSYKDSDGQDVSTTWQFVVTYKSLDPASRVAGTGKNPGFRVHLVQAPPDGGALENSLDRAENQLATGSTIPRMVDTNFVATLINYNKRPGESAGHVLEDSAVPGIDLEANGSDNDFAVEIQTYLELPAGVIRMGVQSDDGYKVATGIQPLGASTAPLAFHNGGPANETFDFVVPVAGLYPFRMIWYERGGAGFGEWTTVNTTSGEYTLVNSGGAIKAWQTVDAPQTATLKVARVAGGLSITSEPQPLPAGWVLQVGASVSGPWVDQTGANTPVTVPIDANAPARFLRAIKR